MAVPSRRQDGVGPGRPGPSAGAAADRRSRAWLASGRVPGKTPEQCATAVRAPLAMRALLRPNGAVAAGWSPGRMYSWPRDSSFAAAALAHTGHDAEAHRILRYSAATQREDGTREARTKLDGSGPPDARSQQLDANGWVPWAAWQWYRTAPRATRRARPATLHPMIRKAADHAAGSLRADGLPPASPDYWELMTSTANIGTAVPLLAGLNASAGLARGRGGHRTRPAGPARRGGCPPGSPRASSPWATSAPPTEATATTARWPSWRPRSTKPPPPCPRRWTPRTGNCCCPTAG
ncbi:hypothetical protein OTB20_28910 [Streptomyces sp. H27-H1]|uniref:hypothetical protein n=1 Tax=Streptomyces sp. H27-H1 TaxID=2996461 RepID=UPI002271489F|nr:hypothetical protein [Streptomyces sp. H27-H1]MCY0930141.1 hypothetical protein [Streptomyces sp. H27-H1]